ncbi:MAG: bifunctional methylenetetrahydrofolate dehydrogenase/methenyltetrahydrofolate cyclohydrolase FolD [Candidatus Sumerlaeia bacterium]|nr:bifunctional methylenetetrahydrofolate dehydrogenase/methenyltetrahydrofolate cyclohydrolase FolD [Candidatus Sumerlaeia bacterium]
MATIIDGKKISGEIRNEIKAGVDELVAGGHRPPGLAVLLVGENPASMAYVRSKTRACAEVGFHSRQINRPASISEEGLLRLVQECNDDPEIHGILVQLPLPEHIDSQKIIEAIDPAKDVDGFHPVNAGRLMVGLPGFVPCTPAGIIEMLVRTGTETSGKHAVVLGRSNIVGKPIAQLLARKGRGGDCTVTIAHSRTRNIEEICQQADIIIAAIGRARFVKGSMIKPGAVIIDVGINRVEDENSEKGYRLVGDVDFDEAEKVAGAITPVPGGVGPMTIALLLRNTLESARASSGLPSSLR